MSQPKDSAIKLFGTMIPVLEVPTRSSDSAGAQASSYGDVVDDFADQNRAPSANSCNVNNKVGEESEIHQDTMREGLREDKKQDGVPTQSSDEVTNLDTSSRSGEFAMPSDEKETTSLNIPRMEEQGESHQEKTTKKPDKILSCPRCNSMDTKFCYYNNYNVNQPRHFCKNCQRYWTAGGTTRNMPIGAGRRKSKNASYHFPLEGAVQNSQSDLLDGVQCPSLSCNSADHAADKLGTDTSTTSVLNLVDKTVNNGAENGGKGKDHPDESSLKQPQEQLIENFQNFPTQAPYFPGAPWPFPWNPAQWSSPLAPVSPSVFLPPGYAGPFYLAPAYWGCTRPSTWNIPWVAQPFSPQIASSNSGPNSLALGKHYREENSVNPNEAADKDEYSKETNKEKLLWVPKTLRINELGEAAKSSMLTTLGIKIDDTESIQREGTFKAFPSKANEKDHAVPNSEVLQANPAALSRSVDFHESS